jgi:hypothetical protein
MLGKSDYLLSSEVELIEIGMKEFFEVTEMFYLGRFHWKVFNFAIRDMVYLRLICRYAVRYKSRFTFFT